ncbi:hypothetical protein CBI38_21840 [Rhodococcus oxybenzonivorans]|uniref:Uncharacterized protein n=1 Tax=Rhodococcus oxybenzonivorans TaxID=1990687 RepID=A0A2S2BYU1_9NOCA|nr:hypothetical protein CBI38_21840 [Rhodococcus oxybenzonivorans]
MLRQQGTNAHCQVRTSRADTDADLILATSSNGALESLEQQPAFQSSSPPCGVDDPVLHLLNDLTRNT